MGRDYTDNHLYQQYLRVLDERDKAMEALASEAAVARQQWERAERYEAVLRKFAEAEHDVCWNTWFIEDAVEALYGPEARRFG